MIKNLDFQVNDYIGRAIKQDGLFRRRRRMIAAIIAVLAVATSTSAALLYIALT